jgi:hypothetical protein
VKDLEISKELRLKIFLKTSLTTDSKIIALGLEEYLGNFDF